MGKTTLFDGLRDKTLPAEIARHAHPDVLAWPALSPRAFPQWIPPLRAIARDGRQVVGASVHLDTTELYEAPKEVEPALQVFSLARTIVVIEISAPAAQIAHQFLDRECRWAFQTNPEAMGPVNTLCAKFWKSQGTKLDSLAIVSAALGAGMQPRYAQRLVNYRNFDWLTQVHANWEAKFARACAGREVALVRIESVPRAPGGYRLIEAGIRAFPAVGEPAAAPA